MSRDLFIEQALFIGQELSEAQFDELRHLQRRHECKAQAMRYLAMREHSRFELGQKLQNKGFEPREYEEVLDELSDENLQSEDRYARLFIEQRLRKKSEGRAVMAQRLGAKRVDRAAAQRALDELYSDELTRSYVRSASDEIASTVGEEMRRAHLHKRGFTSHEIRLALEEWGEDDA